MMLVTLEQASNHLRRDTNDDDSDLTIKIEAASEAVVGYLKGAADAFLDTAGFPLVDSSGNPIVPRQVQSATLLMVGYLYRERDGSNEFPVGSEWGMGFLPAGVTALLYNLRVPTLS